MSEEVMKLALEALEHCKDAIVERGLNGSPEFAEKWGLTLPLERSEEAITALREALAEQPAQQEPAAFPTRKAVEREIERTANPTGMHLNDGKERVALPGGTLRHMLALIDRTSPPAQRKPLTDEQVSLAAHNIDPGDWNDLRLRNSWHDGFKEGARWAAHGIKENT